MEQDFERLKISFDKAADEYDEATSDFSHFVLNYVNRKNLEDILASKNPTRLLEAGCGTGKQTGWLYRFCRELTSLDLSPESLRIAAGKYKQLPIIIIEGNIEKTDFENARFDFIVAEGGVISYTPDPDAMIAEMRRILKPGGSAWIDFYNSLGWACEHGSTDFKIETALADEKLIQMPDWDYPARVFSPGFLQAHLVKAGFVVERFFANGVLLNSFRLEDKGRKDFERLEAERLREIEFVLSRRASLCTTSINCQFLVKKEEQLAP